MEIVNEELMLADLQILENHLKKDRTAVEEQPILKKFIDQLNQGILAKEISVDEKEKEIIRQLNLLTLKKQLVVANIGEEDINKPAKAIKEKPTVSICAKLESELSELSWIEQQQFLKDYQIKKTAKENIILAAYQSLDLATFYTVAKRAEARAWPIKKGSTAVEAAGKIHTDFAKHFIKVEVINAQELINIGSWQQAHHLGKINLHGKDYIIQDQDVVEFKVGIK
jgi:ribosome-binding ATPase YchF (GTP1/OBG family)